MFTRRGRRSYKRKRQASTRCIACHAAAPQLQQTGKGRSAAGRAIIDANRRYFKDTPGCARPHKNEFFIGIGCFFDGSGVYDGNRCAGIEKRAARRFGMIRAGSGEGGAVAESP
jgi:hypothetical protein